VKRKTLFRYLVGEVLPPFFFGLLTFTLILLIARIIKMIELVVTRGVPLLQIGKLFSLILPTFLEMTVPMAFLLAILLGLGRLSNDQELLAMKASGVSPWQILCPIAAVAAIISLITLSLTLFGRPAANLALKKELYHISKSRVTTALKEKVFNDDFPKILIYVEEIVPPGNTAQGILIVDNRDKVRESIVLGKVARINTDEDTNSLGLRLFDGSIYEREKNRPGFSQTRFNIYDFQLDLDELVTRCERKKPDPRNRWRICSTPSGPKSCHPRPPNSWKPSTAFFGFVPFVFCLLGVALTLLPRGGRANRSWGFALCLVWLMVYYALLSLGKALGDKDIVQPVVALWLPNFVVGGIGLYFFRKAMRESPLLIPTLVERAIAHCTRSIARMKQKRAHEVPS
jgi:lipopolysaccharide export system permease protein